ncbi:hypothetical protein AVEN_47312-1, partial [Araneus ventricosus]
MEQVGRNFGFPTSLNIHPIPLDCRDIDINVEIRVMLIGRGGSLPSEETGADGGLRFEVEF